MYRHLAPFLLLLPLSCDGSRGTTASGGGAFIDKPGEQGGEGEGELDGDAGEEGEGEPGRGEAPAVGEGEGEGAGPDEGGDDQGDQGEEGEEGGEGGEGGPGAQCARNSDCDSPLICTPQGVCDVECAEDRDCDGAGEGCKDGVCQAAGADCEGNGDCLPDELCDDGRCRGVPDCIFPDDCEDGLTCVQGQCIEQGGEGGEEAGEEGGEEGGEIDEPAPCPGGPGRPAVPGDYGEACARAADCSCDLCFDEAPAGGGGVCTGYCVQDSDCPGLHTCETVGAVRACVPNDVGDECRDPSECNFGVCLNDPAAGDAVCTKECDSRLECGQGYGCGMVRDQEAGDSWSCVPVGGRCGAAAGCSGSRCLPDAAGVNQGYCTNDCRTSADCDIGNVCCGIPGADGCPVGVCVRGACPAECQGDENCPQGWGCFEVAHPDGGNRNTCVALACVDG